MNFRFVTCLSVVLLASALSGISPGILAQQSAPPVPSKSDERVKVSYCELKKNPAAYNHKLIEVTGFISHGFEKLHHVRACLFLVPRGLA